MGKEEFDSDIWINYRKSNHYRGVHVDGCIIDITPNGLFYINFWAERVAIPKAVNFKLNSSEGKLGESIGISDDSINGYIREIDFGAYIDIRGLKALKDLIEKKIEDHNNEFGEQ